MFDHREADEGKTLTDEMRGILRDLRLHADADAARQNRASIIPVSTRYRCDFLIMVVSILC